MRKWRRVSLAKLTAVAANVAPIITTLMNYYIYDVGDELMNHR